MKKILTALFLIIIGGVNSYACRCEDPGSIQEAYNYTETILQGSVLSKSFVTFKSTMNEAQISLLNEKFKDNPQRLSLMESEFVIKIELKITNVYKGEIKNDTVIIYTTRTGVSCGYTGFETGREYLIYTSSRSHMYAFFDSNANEEKLELENTFWTNHCTRTMVYNRKEAKELKKLANK